MSTDRAYEAPATAAACTRPYCWLRPHTEADHGQPAMTAPTVAACDRSDTLRTGRNYLRRGDPCRVGGERGVFRFVEVVTNTVTGATWAEVVGPANNPRTRSFRTDRLRRVRRDTPTR